MHFLSKAPLALSIFVLVTASPLVASDERRAAAVTTMVTYSSGATPAARHVYALDKEAVRRDEILPIPASDSGIPVIPWGGSDTGDDGNDEGDQDGDDGGEDGVGDPLDLSSTNDPFAPTGTLFEPSANVPHHTSTSSAAAATPTDAADSDIYMISGKMSENENPEELGKVVFPPNSTEHPDYWVIPQSETQASDDPMFTRLTKEDIYAMGKAAACSNKTINDTIPARAKSVNHLDIKTSVWTVGLSQNWEAFWEIPKGPVDISKNNRCMEILNSMDSCVNTAGYCEVPTIEHDVFFRMGIRSPGGDSLRTLTADQYLPTVFIAGKSKYENWNQWRLGISIFNPSIVDVGIDMADYLEQQCYSGHAAGSDNCWGKNPNSQWLTTPEISNQNVHDSFNGTGYVYNAFMFTMEWIGQPCPSKIFRCIVKEFGLDPDAQAHWSEEQHNGGGTGIVQDVENIFKSIINEIDVIGEIFAFLF